MAMTLLDKVNHTVKAAENFILTLDKETTALKKADYATFESLQDEKRDNGQIYQDSILSFEGQLDNLKLLPPAAKNTLDVVYKRFNVAADMNQRALRAACGASERIVNMIMDAAKASVAAEAPGYNAAGKQGLSAKIPVHFKLNEVM